MSNQRKDYDNPKEAIKDLATIGGAAVIHKALKKPVIAETLKKSGEKIGQWVEATPGGTQVWKAGKKLKEKGFYAGVDPFKKEYEIGWKTTFGGKN
jgi:hypothetical protein|tara:strand:- start:110 stop:397 length:288 start_codon:yes stop_codon:yes gene_type:complete